MLNELKENLPILVMEIGINHQGSVELTKDMMDIFFDAVYPYPSEKIYFKFQKREVREEIPEFQWNIPRVHPVTGKTVPYIEYKEDMEFSYEEYKDIDSYVLREFPDDFGGWYTSVWGMSSLYFMLKNFPDSPFIKIPSALIGNKPLIREAAKSGNHVVLSTGGATENDVIQAHCTYQNYRGPYYKFEEQELFVLSCTSTYPTPPDEVNLRKMFTLHDLLPRERIGFSSHSVSPLACILAAFSGATMIEFHVTLDRAMAGSDHAASIEPNGARLIARDILQAQRFIGEDKLEPTESELEKLKTLGK